MCTHVCECARGRAERTTETLSHSEKNSVCATSVYIYIYIYYVYTRWYWTNRTTYVGAAGQGNWSWRFAALSVSPSSPRGLAHADQYHSVRERVKRLDAGRVQLSLCALAFRSTGGDTRYPLTADRAPTFPPASDRGTMSARRRNAGRARAFAETRLLFFPVSQTFFFLFQRFDAQKRNGRRTISLVSGAR